MGFESGRCDPATAWKDIIIDGMVEAVELETFENTIMHDEKVSRNEMRAFSKLLESSINRNGQTIFTPEALLYLNTHFSAAKEKAQKEYEITAWLMVSGVAGGAIGIAGNFFFPASIVPKIVIVAAIVALIAGAVVMSDGSTNVAKHFDDKGNLIIP